MSEGFTVTVRGIEEVLKKLSEKQDKIKGAIAAAVYQEALDLEARSVKQVPVDYGTLRRSHYVAPPDNLNNPTAQAGYGTDYAVYVHEKTEVHHEPPGKAMYLKDPLDETKNGYKERLAKRAKQNLEAGVTLSSVAKTAPTSPSNEGSGHRKEDKARGGTGKGPRLKLT